MKSEQSRAPYYIKLHLGDYERDCVELSPLQDGMYFRLMRWYYSTGKPIPNDIERIYRRVHALSVDEQNAVKYVLENFFLLDGPVWRQRRIDQEIAEWYERSDAGKESAERRWKKSNEIKESGYAKALPTQYEGNANQNQNQNHINPIEAPLAEKSKVNAAKRGSRLNVDSLPEPWKDFCKQTRPDLTPESVFDGFKDFWAAAPGSKGVKADWLATWRNWVRNQRGGTAIVPKKQSPAKPKCSVHDCANESRWRSMRTDKPLCEQHYHMDRHGILNERID